MPHTLINNACTYISYTCIVFSKSIKCLNEITIEEYSLQIFNGLNTFLFSVYAHNEAFKCLTYLHCLQHSFFEHLFNLYYNYRYLECFYIMCKYKKSSAKIHIYIITFKIMCWHLFYFSVQSASPLLHWHTHLLHILFDSYISTL